MRSKEAAPLGLLGLLLALLALELPALPFLLLLLGLLQLGLLGLLELPPPQQLGEATATTVLSRKALAARGSGPESSALLLLKLLPVLSSGLSTAA